jgi:Arc/MetJ-type ribon-helix-helix transcriptional regulator
MVQAKFSLEEEQVQFLNQHKEHGFKDKSAMVRMALEHLKENIERQNLEESAALYAEVYAHDPELEEWTEAAVEEWPE